MKKTPLKRIGKRGKINQEYKKLLKELPLPNYCEARISPNCTSPLFLTPAHRKKRLEYKTAQELADYNEIIVACSTCHDMMEHNKDLTEEVFSRLRTTY